MDISERKRCRTVPGSLNLILCLTLLLFPGIGIAEPFVPEDENFQVVSLSTAVVALHQQLQANDANNEATSARLYPSIINSYRIAVRDNSPRAYGRVFSLLNQWPNGENQPAEIRNIHASVLQHYHNFEQALDIINKAIENNASNLSTQLIRFQIAMVSGDYSLADLACGDVSAEGDEADALNCRSQLQAATGELQMASDNLQAYMSNNPPATIGQLFELLLTAGDIAVRQGNSQRAEMYFTDALRINPENHYLRLQYMDLLLSEGRHDDVLRFIATIPEQHINDEIKILQIRALSAQESLENTNLIETLSTELASSFQQSLEREERLPHKDMALFYYYVEDDPESALRHAHQNWQTQKEISDTLLVYRSALDAGHSNTQQEVASWLEENGTTDARLDDLNDMQREETR